MEKIAYNVQEAAAALVRAWPGGWRPRKGSSYEAGYFGAPGRCARPGGLYLRRVYSPAAGAGGCGGPVRGARKFTSACEFAQKREAAGAANTERPKEKS